MYPETHLLYYPYWGHDPFPADHLPIYNLFQTHSLHIQVDSHYFLLYHPTHYLIQYHIMAAYQSYFHPDHNTLLLSNTAPSPDRTAARIQDAVSDTFPFFQYISKSIILVAVLYYIILPSSSRCFHINLAV